MSHAEESDVRIRRTHKCLHDALIELVSEKGFAAITGGDIAKRAMINHATCYRQYHDKFDLVVQIFAETTNHLVETMTPIPKDAGQKE